MAADVAAGFPQVDLTPLTIITVTLDDPGAVITSLAVHGFQDDGEGNGRAPETFSDPGSPFAFGDVAA